MKTSESSTGATAAASLEARIARIEDERAIERLKYRYAASCDFGFDLDAIASCFAADGRWVANGYADCRGHEEIRSYFARVAKRTPQALHYVTQPRIDIAPSGDRATAQFYLLCLSTVLAGEESKAVVILGTYVDRCVKIDGRWLFEELRVDVRHVAGWTEGWAEQPWPR